MMEPASNDKIVAEIGEAVAFAKRKLASGVTLVRPANPAIATLREKTATTPSFQMKQITSMLRIEVNHAVEADLQYFSYRTWMARDADSPLTFMGVSVYVVRHALPPCGWRIINPMEAE